MFSFIQIMRTTIRENKNYFIMTVGLLIAGGLAGLLYPDLLVDVVPDVQGNSNIVLDFLQVYVSFYTLLLFGFILGIMPLVTMFTMGYIMVAYLISGNFASIEVSYLGFALEVLTIPMYVTISILSLKIGFDWLMKEASGKRKMVLNQTIVDGIRKTSILVWPLIVIYFVGLLIV